MRLLDERRKLVESERKRLVEMQQMLSTEQAMTLLAAVIDGIKKNVPDRRPVAAIAADIGKLAGTDWRTLAAGDGWTTLAEGESS